MYVSRMTFHALPGRTTDVQDSLVQLERMVGDVGGLQPRVLRSHLASPGAPDVVFEQLAPDLMELERQIHAVTDNGMFQEWSQEVSALLADSPKREIYEVTSGDIAG